MSHTHITHTDFHTWIHFHTVVRESKFLIWGGGAKVMKICLNLSTRFAAQICNMTCCAYVACTKKYENCVCLVSHFYVKCSNCFVVECTCAFIQTLLRCIRYHEFFSWQNYWGGKTICYAPPNIFMAPPPPGSTPLHTHYTQVVTYVMII